MTNEQTKKIAKINWDGGSVKDMTMRDAFEMAALIGLIQRKYDKDDRISLLEEARLLAQAVMNYRS